MEHAQARIPSAGSGFRWSSLCFILAQPPDHHLLFHPCSTLPTSALAQLLSLPFCTSCCRTVLPLPPAEWPTFYCLSHLTSSMRLLRQRNFLTGCHGLVPREAPGSLGARPNLRHLCFREHHTGCVTMAGSTPSLCFSFWLYKMAQGSKISPVSPNLTLMLLCWRFSSHEE